MQMTSGSPNQKLTLVLARDAKADGRFVYAVKSTGVYLHSFLLPCARRPRRENVQFFDSPMQAQQAGYRSLPPLHWQTQRNPQTQKVEAACRVFNKKLDITLSLTAISRHVAISPFHFQRLFKRILGIRTAQVSAGRRAGKLRQALLAKATY